MGQRWGELDVLITDEALTRVVPTGSPVSIVEIDLRSKQASAISWQLIARADLMLPRRRSGPSATTSLDYGWRAFRNRSESETQPSIASTLKQRGVVITARQSMPERLAHAVC
jgi:hypothetical protein